MVVVKAKWETELEELMETPVKRRRAETAQSPDQKQALRVVEESPLKRKIKA